MDITESVKAWALDQGWNWLTSPIGWGHLIVGVIGFVALRKVWGVGRVVLWPALWLARRPALWSRWTLAVTGAGWMAYEGAPVEIWVLAGGMIVALVALSSNGAGESDQWPKEVKNPEPKYFDPVQPLPPPLDMSGIATRYEELRKRYAHVLETGRWSSTNLPAEQPPADQSESSDSRILHLGGDYIEVNFDNAANEDEDEDEDELDDVCEAEWSYRQFWEAMEDFREHAGVESLIDQAQAPGRTWDYIHANELFREMWPILDEYALFDDTFEALRTVPKEILDDVGCDLRRVLRFRYELPHETLVKLCELYDKHGVDHDLDDEAPVDDDYCCAMSEADIDQLAKVSVDNQAFYVGLPMFEDTIWDAVKARRSFYAKEKEEKRLAMYESPVDRDDHRQLFTFLLKLTPYTAATSLMLTEALETLRRDVKDHPGDMSGWALAPVLEAIQGQYRDFQVFRDAYIDGLLATTSIGVSRRIVEASPYYWLDPEAGDGPPLSEKWQDLLRVYSTAYSKDYFTKRIKVVNEKYAPADFTQETVAKTPLRTLELDLCQEYPYKIYTALTRLVHASDPRWPKAATADLDVVMTALCKKLPASFVSYDFSDVPLKGVMLAVRRLYQDEERFLVQLIEALTATKNQRVRRAFAEQTPDRWLCLSSTDPVLSAGKRGQLETLWALANCEVWLRHRIQEELRRPDVDAPAQVVAVEKADQSKIVWPWDYLEIFFQEIGKRIDSQACRAHLNVTWDGFARSIGKTNPFNWDQSKELKGLLMTAQNMFATNAEFLPLVGELVLRIDDVNTRMNFLKAWTNYWKLLGKDVNNVDTASSTFWIKVTDAYASATSPADLHSQLEDLLDEYRRKEPKELKPVVAAKPQSVQILEWADDLHRRTAAEEAKSGKTIVSNLWLLEREESYKQARKAFCNITPDLGLEDGNVYVSQLILAALGRPRSNFARKVFAETIFTAIPDPDLRRWLVQHLPIALTWRGEEVTDYYVTAFQRSKLKRVLGERSTNAGTSFDFGYLMRVAALPVSLLPGDVRRKLRKGRAMPSADWAETSYWTPRLLTALGELVRQDPQWADGVKRPLGLALLLRGLKLVDVDEPRAKPRNGRLATVEAMIVAADEVGMAYREETTPEGLAAYCGEAEQRLRDLWIEGEKALLAAKTPKETPAVRSKSAACCYIPCVVVPRGEVWKIPSNGYATGICHYLSNPDDHRAWSLNGYNLDALKRIQLGVMRPITQAIEEKLAQHNCDAQLVDYVTVRLHHKQPGPGSTSVAQMVPIRQDSELSGKRLSQLMDPYFTEGKV